MRRAARPARRVAALALPFTLAAVAVSASPRPFMVQRWSVEDGLPHAGVGAIAQTADGFLWVGTARGLARFDGARFTVFDRRATPVLEDARVSGLRVAPDGALIVTTPSAVLSLHEGAWTERLRLGPDARAFAASAAETIVVGDGRVSRLLPHGISELARLPPGPRVVRDAVQRDALWIAGSDGLMEIRDGKVLTLDERAGLPDRDIHAVLVDREGRLWVGTSRGLAVRERGGREFRADPRIGVRPVFALLETLDGELWVGSEELYHLGPAGVDVIGRAEGLVANVVTLFEDRDGAVWAGTYSGGLHRVRRGVVGTITTRDGLATESVTAVLAGADEDVWIGTYRGGLHRFRDGRLVRRYGKADGLASDQVYALEAGPSGRLWIGTYGAGVQVLCGDRICAGPPVPDPWVLSLAEDARGRLWVGSRTGLAVMEGGVARPLLADGRRVHAVRADRTGTVWAGGAMGLARVEADRLVEVVRPSRPGESIVSVTLGRDGVVWAGGDAGLFRVRHGQIGHLTRAHGLPDDAVHQVLEDARGDLWLTGVRGVARLSRREVEEVLEGDRERLEPLTYLATDGLPGAEGARGSQPSGTRDGAGRLLFAMSHGVAIVDPARTPALKPPTPLVERVVADGQEHVGAGWTAGPGIDALEFHYTAPLLGAPERLRFRYRLRGYSRGWTEAGGRRLATFTHVPAGEYVFELQAAVAGEASPATAAAVPFAVAPAWHERADVHLVLASIVLGLVALAYRIRVRRLLERERRTAEAICDERQRVSRELHDSVNQLLFGLTLTTEAALEERGDRSALLRRADTLGRAALAEMRSLIRQLHRRPDDPAPAVDLTVDLARYAAALSRPDLSVTVASRYGGRGPSFDRELLRIAQEAIGNAVRHGGARNVHVSLQDVAGELTLRVEDDGTGLSGTSPAPGTGIGLQSMQDRARAIGAHLSLSHGADGGTVVELTSGPDR